MAIPFLAVALCALPILAQDHQDDAHGQKQQDHHDQGRKQGGGHQVRQDDWKKGNHMRQEDWNRGRRVDDWKARNFRRPPRGYEWRNIDGRYVLANPSGLILDIHLR